MTTDIKPTRTELIKLKKRIKLAKSGHKLLKKKRDGLILEFFEVLKKAKTLREELTGYYRKAQKKMNYARVVESDLKIRSIAMAISQEPDIELEEKNIVGVVVPKIDRPELHKKMEERGHGYFNSAAIDEAATQYEYLVEKILEAAEVETTMRKMLEEIEKTKRRVNALEFEVIPKLEVQEAFIKMRLEEQERENFSRLKIIKGR
ncbi:V-type ATP synthase subunit D [Nanoarchaeota archaeon]